MYLIYAQTNQGRTPTTSSVSCVPLWRGCLVDQPTGHVYNIRATICLLSFRPFTIEGKKRKPKRKRERGRRADTKSNEKKRENRGSTGIGYKLLRPVKRKAPRGPCEWTVESAGGILLTVMAEVSSTVFFFTRNSCSRYDSNFQSGWNPRLNSAAKVRKLIPEGL